MHVHRNAALRNRPRVTSRSGRVSVTRVSPDVMALARIMAHGDRRIVVQRDGSALIANGAR
jgi:hypothetical protein